MEDYAKENCGLYKKIYITRNKRYIKIFPVIEIEIERNI